MADGAVSVNVTELIKGHEGLRLKPYLCTAGRTSIGYGRNLDDTGISEVEAEAMLLSDIANCRRLLAFNVPRFEQLDEVRQAALVDLCYNMGWMGLGRFRRFLAALDRSDWLAAANELRQSKWYGQVGHRAPRITAMVETGQWPHSQ